jgi:hypothetical protein
MSTIRFALVTVFSTWFLLINAPPLLAQDRRASEAERFAQQYDAVLKRIQKIPDDVKILQEMIKRDKNPENDIAKIQEFRKVVSDALGAVVDNGSLEIIAKTFVSDLEQELKNAMSDTHYDDNQKKIIVNGWRKDLDEAKIRVSNLNRARADISKMLSYIQTQEDFFVEILRQQQQEEIFAMLDALTNELSKLSEDLKDIQMKVPSL